jgi:hypothetical protein
VRWNQGSGTALINILAGSADVAAHKHGWTCGGENVFEKAFDCLSDAKPVNRTAELVIIIIIIHGTVLT